MAKIHEIQVEDPTLRTFILFMQAAREVMKYADAYLYKKASLSSIKLVVLQALNLNGGRITPSQLAEWTQTERHNITALVDIMKEDGLVTTRKNNQDKRIVNIYLSGKGRDILKSTLPLAIEAINQVMASIDVEDASAFSMKLRSIRDDAHLGLQLLE